FSFLQSGSSSRTTPPGAAARLPVYGTVPDFLLLERSGRPIRLADLHGQIWIASFVFTNCTEACPLLTAAMAQLQTDFMGIDRVRLVSITLDPEHDTLPVLARYAAGFGADPQRWLFLTGDQDSIYQLVREGFRLYVSDAQRESSQRLRHALISLVDPSPALADHGGAKDPVHAARLVLVDGSARIRGYYDGTDPDALLRLRQHVRPLLEEE
ncbi:MAG: SCO family protein, partial [Candidatus Entotheonellia bacterium]